MHIYLNSKFGWMLLQQYIRCIVFEGYKFDEQTLIVCLEDGIQPSVTVLLHQKPIDQSTLAT